MQLDQSESANEIQWKVKVLARSITSSEIGLWKHHCKPGYSPKPRSKDNDQLEGQGETDSLGGLVEKRRECQARLAVIPDQIDKADLFHCRGKDKLVTWFRSLSLQHRSG